MRISRNILSRLNQRSRRILAVSLGACCVLGVIAYASIPDANGVIHGCYKQGSGTLRVIDDAVNRCDSNENPIEWNQTGPQGAPAPPRLITVGTGFTGALEQIACSTGTIRTVNFVKQSDTSVLRITYHDDGFVEANPNGAHEFSIGVLIDGSDTAPTRIYNNVQGDLDNLAVTGSITAFGYAYGISAGPHTLSSRYFEGGQTCWRIGAYTVEIEELAAPTTPMP